MTTANHISLDRPEAGLQALLARAWPWLIVASVGLAAFSLDALASLAIAWQRPEYSYGPMVPLVTAFITLREIHRRPPLPDAGSHVPGLALVALGLLVGLSGNLAGVPDLGTYGFIIAIGGFALIVAGTREGLRFWPGFVHLVFMLPLPQFLYLHLSIALQALSSQMGAGFIDAMGIPVFREGNVIDLGSYQLQVAEACSGLSYLFPILSFGWLVAVLYMGPAWHRVVIFLSAVPITVVMNSLRIAIIGVLVNSFGIAQAEGFIHLFEGWAVFMACTAILYGEAWLLQRLASGGKRYPAVLDTEFRGILEPLKKLPQLAATPALAAAALLVLVAGVAWQLHPQAEPQPVERRSMAGFPLVLGPWRGEVEHLDANVLRVLAADDHVSVRYGAAAERLDLLLTYYAAQTGAAGGVHSPEVCLPAGGWEVSQWSRRGVAVAGAEGGITVNRAVISKGAERQLVYYWFEQRGGATPSEYTAKFMALWGAITTGRSDGGLVRLTTPLAPGEDPAAGDLRLAGAMQRVVPLLPGYFPDR